MWTHIWNEHKCQISFGFLIYIIYVFFSFLFLSFFCCYKLRACVCVCLSYLLTRNTYAESEVDCILRWYVCVCDCVFIWISLNILFTLVENCNELMMYRFAVKQPTYQDTIHLWMFFFLYFNFPVSLSSKRWCSEWNVSYSSLKNDPYSPLSPF